MGEARGIASKAARLAGYTGNANVLGVTGHQLLKRPKIKNAIGARRDAAPEIATRAERQATWSAMMRDTKRPDYIRLKAMELLGRSQADFVEVRMAPIVTDPHASVESLVERFNAIVQTIEARRLLTAAPSKQPTAAKS